MWKPERSTVSLSGIQLVTLQSNHHCPQQTHSSSPDSSHKRDKGTIQKDWGWGWSLRLPVTCPYLVQIHQGKDYFFGFQRTRCGSGIWLQNLEGASATSIFQRSRCVWGNSEVTNRSAPPNAPCMVKSYNARKPPLNTASLFALPLNIPVAFAAFSITMTVKAARDRNITKIFSLCITPILTCNKLEKTFGYLNMCLGSFHVPETASEINTGNSPLAGFSLVLVETPEKGLAGAMNIFVWTSIFL